MGTDPGDLYLLAEEFLSACEDALNTIPIAIPGLDGAPARSYVAPGRPAADCCPQLTVHTQGILEEQLGAVVPGRSYMTSRLNQVTLAMTLFRCAPTEKVMPEVAELVAASTQVNADAWALWNHLFNMVKNGLLFSTCGEVHWNPMSAIQPEGSCVGWYWPVEVALDGYEETATS